MYDLHAQQHCPPNTDRYYLQAGDTLYGLARRYGTTVAAIEAANPGLDPNALQIGWNICIPRQPVYPSCPGGTYYTVRRGDTMYAIAARHNITLNDLIAANPSANPNTLAIGQVLCIPSAAPVPPPVTACPTGYTAYTVVAGDTMYGIAVRYGIDLNALIAANPSANPNALVIGQTLCLPPATAPAVCPSGSTAYPVAAGDTMYAIALRYGKDLNALIAANPTIDPNNLQAGQTICIPS